MVGVTIDMTERKQAEEKIREQAALLDKARDAIIVVGFEGYTSFIGTRAPNGFTAGVPTEVDRAKPQGSAFHGKIHRPNSRKPSKV